MYNIQGKKLCVISKNQFLKYFMDYSKYEGLLSLKNYLIIDYHQKYFVNLLYYNYYVKIN